MNNIRKIIFQFQYKYNMNVELNTLSLVNNSVILRNVII